MSAETGTLATTPHPLGKPGSPGLFHDRSLSLPPYIQNIAHSLMEKRGMDKSKAIQVAIGVVQNWASGRGNVKPEVRAAATAAITAWEAAKAKARATPNKDVKLSRPMTLIRGILDSQTVKPPLPGNDDDTVWSHADVRLSQPMALLRTVLDGPRTVDLAAVPADGSTRTPHKTAPKQSKKDEQRGKHKLPPGAVGWKHNWVPVDKNGNPVGPSQKDKSASEIQDMAGHTEATKAAIRQAYANKAKAAGKAGAAKASHTAAKAKADAQRIQRKAEVFRKRAAAEARRRAKAKERAQQKAASEAKRKATAAAKAKAAQVKAHQKLVSEATRQALADKKAGRGLTPSQQRLIDAYEKQQADKLDQLRNDVKLAQPVAPSTVATVSSQDGARGTVNLLKDRVPKRVLSDAVKQAQKKRRGRRKGEK